MMIMKRIIVTAALFASTTTAFAPPYSTNTLIDASIRHQQMERNLLQQKISPSNSRTKDDNNCFFSLYTTWSSPSQQPQQQKQQSSSSTDNNNNNKNGFLDEKTRQLLGVRAASIEDNTEKWKIRLQLMKPITWVPLSMIVMLGALSSGQYNWDDPSHIIRGLFAIILTGPFSEGFAQVINDWYDRDIDAINEPYRPIPAGIIKPYEVFQQLAFLFFGGMSIAIGLDYYGDNDLPVFATIALLGYMVSYIYSAPPLKLKQNGWYGALAIGLCYISFPWWCRHAAFTNNTDHWVIPILYSLSGIGAAIVNDFKSMENDKQLVQE